MSGSPPSFRPAARWLPPPSPPAGVAESLEEALRPDGSRAGQVAVPAAVCRLLAARGVHTAEAAKRFLRPLIDHVESPECLADLPRAAERLAAAIGARETILVHGDYDVDGICSTSLMTIALRALGGVVVPFIPDRMTDGYDLGPAGVAAAIAEKAKVVLTCDCGTTAHAPAESLAAAGIDLIISDHHLPGGPLPKAYAVINPRRADCPSRDKDLAAVGVAYKLALAVTRLRGGDEALVHRQLDLVALATIADVAPLRGENRVFARLGLRQLALGTNIGLAALVRAARLDEKGLTAGRVGFTLAPRLNALGRLRQALRGVELLLATDTATANAIARECEELNEQRQAMDRRILAEAMARVAKMDLADTWGIVLDSRDWHAGVIGIVASRVVEQTGRPAFMIAVDGSGEPGAVRLGKGSGRSVGAFDLHAALQECTDLLLKHGGHRAAAGLTIAEERIPEFAARFNEIARSKLTHDDLAPQLRTDLELPLHEADELFERAQRHLEPFGVGNPGPVLVSHGVRLKAGARKIGTDGVKVAFAKGEGMIEAVGWGMASRAATLVAGAVVDIAYRLDVNEYNGRRTLQLVLQDFRPAKDVAGPVG
ncbi:MAG TPA: single-stranded-DNA-specific exonuclease RecJ [Gemmatimonadaceae bacterium]|nr:single-stranded-DNA-specific exonuclease RecJ [Gemmatimonadaceae bacterium]